MLAGRGPHDAGPIVAPMERPLVVGAVNEAQRTCGAFVSDLLVRELVKASWDETGIGLNRGRSATHPWDGGSRHADRRLVQMSFNYQIEILP